MASNLSFNRCITRVPSAQSFGSFSRHICQSGDREECQNRIAIPWDGAPARLTLVGFGNEPDKLVVLTDGDVLMNVVALLARRDAV
jgi:hypothetical protein